MIRSQSLSRRMVGSEQWSTTHSEIITSSQNAIPKLHDIRYAIQGKMNESTLLARRTPKARCAVDSRIMLILLVLRISMQILSKAL